MTDTFPLLIGALLANTLVLARLFGGCPYFGPDGGIENLRPLGYSIAAVLAVAAPTIRLIDQFVLSPFDLQYLHLVVSVFLIAGLVQLADIVLRARNPLLHATFGLHLQLSSFGCAMLGVALLETVAPASLFAVFFVALCIAVGLTFVIALFTALNHRLDNEKVPAPLRGTPVALIAAGLTSLAFMGFSGVGH